MFRSVLTCSGLAVTAWLLASASAPGQDVKPATKPEVINLYMSKTRALLMLRVGDAPPLPVVFDTGTNGNLIDTGVAERLGLPNTGPSPSVDGDTGKPVQGHDSLLRGASLGGVVIPDDRLSVLDYNQTDEVGIFGPNSFPDRLVEMDGPHSRLTIRTKSQGVLPTGPAVPYLGDGGAALPSAVLDFGDLKVPAILDTGNDSAIILPLPYKDRLTLDGPPRLIGYAVSAAGRQPILMAHLAGTVRIGGVTLVKPEIRFMDGGRPNIGLPILRKISVVYDPSGSQSWITSTGEIAP